jgi:hypothetical protein
MNSLDTRFLAVTAGAYLIRPSRFSAIRASAILFWSGMCFRKGPDKGTP